MIMSDYDVIYKEQVYKCVDMNPVFEYIPRENTPDNGPIAQERPKSLDVMCVDSDGCIIILRDETFMFRFVRKQK